MKTLILAGGLGTRMGHLAEVIPTPMVKIGGKPVLWHIMKIYSHFGHNDFIIPLGVKGEVIKEYFYNFETLNNDFSIDLSSGQISYHNKQVEAEWKVTLVDTGINTLKGGRVKRLEKYLDDEINMLTYGDGVSDININSLLKFHKSHGKIITLSGVNAPSRFGELIIENQMVKSFVEKPQMSVGMINGGFMVFSKKLMKFLSDSEDCDFEFGTLEELAKKGQVMVYKHDGNWECMDNKRDVNYLENLWNTNRAFWKIW